MSDNDSSASYDEALYRCDGGSERVPSRSEQYYYPDGTPCPYTPEDAPDFGTWDAVLNGGYP